MINQKQIRYVTTSGKTHAVVLMTEPKFKEISQKEIADARKENKNIPANKLIIYQHEEKQVKEFN